MRSTWSVETVLAVLAAASVEAAALTLAYLAVNWFSGRVEIHLGVPAFAVSVVLGLVLARRLRHASWERYLLVLPGAAILAGAVGGWLAEATAGAPADPLSVLGNAGPWLLGIGVLRGTAHAELDDEAYTVDRLLRIGMPGLAAFWIVAAAGGLPGNAEYTATAFGATLTFVSSALLALGLGRLGELRVEAIDQAARRRWLALLFGVSGLVLVVGLPLAAVLEVPLVTVLAGASGPIATVLVLVFVALAAPIIVILSAIIDWIGPLNFGLSIPAIHIATGNGSSVPPDVLTVVAWVIGVIAAADLLAILVVLAAVLRRRRKRRLAGAPELREAEPVGIGLAFRIPRLRPHRRPGGTPGNAVDAYRLALALLAGRDEGRRAGETPREHATRIRATEVGPSVGRLAADYQLAALGGRRLSSAEEHRAHDRWRRIRRWAR